MHRRWRRHRRLRNVRRPPIEWCQPVNGWHRPTDTAAAGYLRVACHLVSTPPVMLLPSMAAPFTSPV